MRSHVHALGGKVLARGTDVLGRQRAARALLHRAVVVEAFAHRDHHLAFRDAEVERLVKTLPAVLEQDVAPGHTEVAAPYCT